MRKGELKYCQKKKKKPFDWMDILIPLEYDMRIGGKGISFLFLCFVIYVRFQMLTCYIDWHLAFLPLNVKRWTE